MMILNNRLFSKEIASNMSTRTEHYNIDNLDIVQTADHRDASLETYIYSCDFSEEQEPYLGRRTASEESTQESDVPDCNKFLIILQPVHPQAPLQSDHLQSNKKKTFHVLMDIMRDRELNLNGFTKQEHKTVIATKQLVASSNPRADSKYKAVLTTVKRFLMRDIKAKDRKLNSTNPFYYHPSSKIRKIILTSILGPISDERCNAIWNISKGPTRQWQNDCTFEGTNIKFIEFLIDLLEHESRPVQSLYFEEKIRKCIEDLVEEASEQGGLSHNAFHEFIQAKLKSSQNDKAKTKFPMTVSQFETAVQTTIEKLRNVSSEFRDDE